MAMPRAENAALDAWQALEEPEEVLEPELEIVDPVRSLCPLLRGCGAGVSGGLLLTPPRAQHHHLWDWREPHVPGANPGVNLDWE